MSASSVQCWLAFFEGFGHVTAIVRAVPLLFSLVYFQRHSLTRTA